MKTKLASLLVLTILVGLMGNAYAHKSEVVGDYKIEVGWKNEPPVTGINNEITLTVTTATAFDKSEAEKEDQAMEGMDMHSEDNGMNMTDQMETDHHDSSIQHIMGEAITTGILKGFTASVTLGEEEYPLTLVEDSKYPGVYHAQFMPSETGYPMVNISGNLNGEDTDVTFHPEMIEKLSVLPPLKQMKFGIPAEDVQCKDGYDLYKRVGSDSSLCLHPSGGEHLLSLGLVELF